MIKHFRKYLPKREDAMHKRILMWAATIFVGLFALGLILFIAMITVLSIGLPDVTKLDNLTAAQSTEIFDKNGDLLYTIHGEENREQVAYDEIAETAKQATVAIEDSDFWNHKGFDLFGIGKAVMYEITGIGTPRGGSTITQQYIKNAFLSSERSYIRKAKELILAVRIERAYDKEKILELYLNRIPYGNNAYGIQKAAEVYFGKDAADLTLAESAVLASLPQAPSRYNPYGDNRYSHLIKEFTPDELHARKIDSEFDLETEEYARGLIGKHVDIGGIRVYIAGRTDLVLRQMASQGMIEDEDRQEALNELQTMEFNEYREAIKHPHFVLYVKQILEDRYGKDVVESGGLKVYTTLDPDLQEYAEEVAEQRGAINQTSFGANNLAILTIDSTNGHILAMVGSRDYFNEEIDGNVNVVVRPRQPGSSFKPIVYAQAFNNGYAPGNVIYDVPTRVGQNRPQNYDGQWQGQISVRRALGQSRNIPAIKAYFLAGEQDQIIPLAEKMGISTLDPSHSYGYPLALGAGEVPLIEMVTAFGTFSNGGKRPELTPILRVENARGDILEEWQEKEFESVLDPQVAFLINDVLSDQSVSVGPRLFVSGKTNAAKTGTSTKSNKQETGGSVRPSDAWTLGYTPSIVTGVWVGNSDGSGLAYNANGYDAASPIFNAVMTKALEGRPNEDFPKPEEIRTVAISKASGKLPGADTPPDMISTEVFSSWSVPKETESMFFKVKIDKISGLRATEFTPEEAIEEVTFQNYQPIAPMFTWLEDIIAYYQQYDVGEQAGDVRVGVPPNEFDNVHTAQTEARAPSISILDPSSNSEIEEGVVTVEVDVEGGNGIDRVEYYVDDKLEYSSKSYPYNGTLVISRFLTEGSHLIVAKAIDDLGYSSQSAVEVNHVKE